MEKGCSSGDIAVALDLPRNGGADLEGFVARLNAKTITDAGQDTMAAIVVAAAAEETGGGGDWGGETTLCPGQSNRVAFFFGMSRQCVLCPPTSHPNGRPQEWCERYGKAALPNQTTPLHRVTAVGVVNF